MLPEGFKGSGGLGGLRLTGQSSLLFKQVQQGQTCPRLAGHAGSGKGQLTKEKIAKIQGRLCCRRGSNIKGGLGRNGMLA